MSFDAMITSEIKLAIAAPSKDAAITTAPTADEQRHIDALKHITNLQKQVRELPPNLANIRCRSSALYPLSFVRPI